MLLYLLAAMIDEPAANAPPPALHPAAPPHNYLKPLPACDKGDADEVVVCADRDADRRYRLKPIDTQAYADPPIRAETHVAGGDLGLAGQAMDLHGWPSNRVMVNFKIKF